MAALEMFGTEMQPTHIDITRLSGHKKILVDRINTMCKDLINNGYVPGRLVLTKKQYGYLKRCRELQDYDFRLYKAEDRVYVNEHCAMELEIKAIASHKTK